MSSTTSLSTPPETPQSSMPSSQAGSNGTILADDPYLPGIKEPCVASTTEWAKQLVDKFDVQQSEEQQQAAGYQQSVPVCLGLQQSVKSGYPQTGNMPPPSTLEQHQLQLPQQQHYHHQPIFQQPGPWVQPPQVFQPYGPGCQCVQCYQANFFHPYGPGCQFHQCYPANFFPQPTLNLDTHAVSFQSGAGGYYHYASPQPPLQPPVFAGPPPSQPQPQTGPSSGPQRYPYPPPRRPRPDRHRGMDGKPLNDEDYDCRKVGKLCFYCGQEGHFVCDCPEEHRKHERKQREWIMLIGEDVVEKDLARAAAAAKRRHRERLTQAAAGCKNGEVCGEEPEEGAAEGEGSK